MRKVLILALMSMFFAAMACNKQQGTASAPEASPSEAASPAGGEASPAGGGGMASPAGGEASPAAAPS
jgi:hypothetical protein